jgi:uncharacterized membrane protein YdfJ with MMPL/SSD domain
LDEFINEIVLLVGLAVGVDYSLFYRRRQREEKARGRSPKDAVAIAAATSGRAVLISGVTVMVAMASCSRWRCRRCTGTRPTAAPTRRRATSPS